VGEAQVDGFRPFPINSNQFQSLLKKVWAALDFRYAIDDLRTAMAVAGQGHLNDLVRAWFLLVTDPRSGGDAGTGHGPARASMTVDDRGKKSFRMGGGKKSRTIRLRQTSARQGTRRSKVPPWLFNLHP
jgi:hypothetical protein